jgi:hypothetical protein
MNTKLIVGGVGNGDDVFVSRERARRRTDLLTRKKNWGRCRGARFGLDFELRWLGTLALLDRLYLHQRYSVRFSGRLTLAVLQTFLCAPICPGSKYPSQDSHLSKSSS